MEKKPIPTEAQEQKALIQWASYVSYKNGRLTDYLIHIPNGGKRDYKEAMKLKLMGVRPGVSDLFMAIPNGRFHGLWLELKRIIRTPTTKQQREWLARMREEGYCAEIAFGWEEAKEIVDDYLADPMR